MQKIDIGDCYETYNPNSDVLNLDIVISHIFSRQKVR